MSKTVSTLEQPTTFAGLSTRVEKEIEYAYWNFDARRKGYTRNPVQSERDAFKNAVRDMFHALRQP